MRARSFGMYRGIGRDDTRNHDHIKGHWNGRHRSKQEDQSLDFSDRDRGVKLHTHSGDDAIIGTDFRDRIFAGSGDDTVTGGQGNDWMFGGRGNDTAVFSGSVLDYTIKQVGCGPWYFVSGPDGHDFLHSFETLQFSDATFSTQANNLPLAQLRGDAPSGSEDGSFDFALDLYDLDGDTLTVESVEMTGDATVSVTPGAAQTEAVTGSSTGLVVTVDPGTAYQSLAEGETTTETVTLVLSDGQGGLTTLSYDITIVGVNDAPVALAVAETADEDGPAIAIAADFSDVDASDTHSFSVDTTGTLGTVTNNGDGTFSYDPNGAFEALAAGETATDTFTFTVDDGKGGTDTETVTVIISGSNDAPVVAAVSGSTEEDGPAITIAADFSDVDASDSHSFSIDTTGTLGTVTNNGDGTFGYDPAGAFEHLGCDKTATDSFTYTVGEVNGGIATETVTMTITGSNDAPVVSGPLFASEGEDGAALTLDLLANASDAEMQALAVTRPVVTSSDGRTVAVSIDKTNGELTLDPSQFNDLAEGETATVTVDYGVVEADSVYCGTSGAETLDNYGTFFIADDDTGALIRIKRTSSVPSETEAFAAAGVTNGSLILIDGNSIGLSVSTRAISDGQISNVGVSGVDLGGYTGPVTVDSSAVPARYVVVNGDMTNETITVEIPRAGGDCGDGVHIFTVTGVTQGNGVSYGTPQIGGLELEATSEPVPASAVITITGSNDAPVIDAPTSDLVMDIGAGFTTAGSFDAEDFLDAFDPTAGTAVLKTVNGKEALQVKVNGDNQRAPHTFLDIVDAGALAADDKVTITVNGEVTRTGGDQDIFFGLTDGVGQVSYFGVNGRAGRLYNGDLRTDAQPGDSVQNGGIYYNLLNLSGAEQNRFSLEIVLDGSSDTISVFTSTGTLLGTFDGFDPNSAVPDQTNAIDPSLGLSLFLASDNAAETNNFVSLDYAMEIERTGTINFADADVSDVHSASVDAVRFVGDTNGMTKAQARALLDLTVNSTATDAAGSVDWAFALSDLDVSYLAEGETLSIAYDVTVDDGNGSTDTETVTVTVTGTNDAPVAEAISASVTEDPQTVLSDDIGSMTMGNWGRWYVFDFDTGTATTVARDGGANNTSDQVAEQYLSAGNGIIAQPNPNGSGWVILSEVFVDGVGQPVPSAEYVVTDTSGGTFSLLTTPLQIISFPDANKDVDNVSLTLTDIDLGDGRSVDVTVDMGPFDYEVVTTDDLNVSSVSFTATVNGPRPEVTVVADFADPDSDTFTFGLDSSGTLGSVTNNGDGTYTYSADGAFEYLGAGESATDTFIYTVDDGDGGLDSEVVTVTILGQDDLILA